MQAQLEISKEDHSKEIFKLQKTVEEQKLEVAQNRNRYPISFCCLHLLLFNQTEPDPAFVVYLSTFSNKKISVD